MGDKITRKILLTFDGANEVITRAIERLHRWMDKQEPAISADEFHKWGGTDQRGLLIRNSNNTVHIIYLGCPACGADLELRESTLDQEGWQWMLPYCPACKTYPNDPHIAIYDAIRQAREFIPQRTIKREVSPLAETIKEKLSVVESSALPTLQVDVTDRLLTHMGYGEYGKIEQRERKMDSGWEKINGLPTLKRAIILSEIIGKPKSLE